MDRVNLLRSFHGGTESLVGHIPLALEDLDPTYQRGGPLGFGSQDIYSGLGVFRSYTATRWTKPNF